MLSKQEIQDLKEELLNLVYTDAIRADPSYGMPHENQVTKDIIENGQAKVRKLCRMAERWAEVIEVLNCE